MIPLTKRFFKIGVTKSKGFLEYEGADFGYVEPNVLIETNAPLKISLDKNAIKQEAEMQTFAFDRPGLMGLTPDGRIVITTAAAPKLRHSAVVLGHIVEGIDTVKKISETARGANRKPNRPAKIFSVLVKTEAGR
jgi:cyclophilin family peptidyl-prolyl cis-trans isomerase